jgi:hypothetical protein
VSEGVEIELRFKDGTVRRHTLLSRVNFVKVPVPDVGGFGELVFAFSGQKTADGLEIWTPLVRH